MLHLSTVVLVVPLAAISRNLSQGLVEIPAPLQIKPAITIAVSFGPGCLNPIHFLFSELLVRLEPLKLLNASLFLFLCAGVLPALVLG